MHNTMYRALVEFGLVKIYDRRLSRRRDQSNNVAKIRISVILYFIWKVIVTCCMRLVLLCVTLDLLVGCLYLISCGYCIDWYGLVHMYCRCSSKEEERRDMRLCINYSAQLIGTTWGFSGR
ncbi:hypothetical protein F4774DRAFT_367064 [Daldinia eschscholtzii]|nr:hypothetical protein F4774DRAFT_367064 [Daldinia eschscholtzii]